jgi:hypothetical protein
MFLPRKSPGTPGVFFTAGPAGPAGPESRLECAGTGRDGPGFGELPPLNDVGAFVEGDGGADVPGKGLEEGAGDEACSGGGFHHDVFLVVGEDGGVGQFRKEHPWLRHFAGYRFVSEIEADQARPGPAYHPGQQVRGIEKIQVGIFPSITRIPKYAGSGAEFEAGPTFSSVNGKGGGAACDEPRDGKTLRLKGGIEDVDRGESGFAGGCALPAIGVVDMAVVGVEAAEFQSRGLGKFPVERVGVGARCDSGTVLTDIEVEQHLDIAPSGVKPTAQGLSDSQIVDECGEAGFREAGNQPCEPFLIRADWLECQQDIRGAGAGGHFGL